MRLRNYRLVPFFRSMTFITKNLILKWKKNYVEVFTLGMYLEIVQVNLINVFWALLFLMKSAVMLTISLI